MGADGAADAGRGSSWTGGRQGVTGGRSSGRRWSPALARVSLRRGLTGALSEAVARPEGGDASRRSRSRPRPAPARRGSPRSPGSGPGSTPPGTSRRRRRSWPSGILGIGALIALIPWPDVPAIPLPDIPSPDIPWPDVSLPDVTLPGWIDWILETSNWWAPVLVAIVIAIREARRRRRRAENAEREDPRPDAR